MGRITHSDKQHPMWPYSTAMTQHTSCQSQADQQQQDMMGGLYIAGPRIAMKDSAHTQSYSSAEKHDFQHPPALRPEEGLASAGERCSGLFGQDPPARPLQPPCAPPGCQLLLSGIPPKPLGCRLRPGVLAALRAGHCPARVRLWSCLWAGVLPVLMPSAHVEGSPKQQCNCQSSA